MNLICDNMGDATPEELDAMMTELGEIQDTLDSHDFYIIDTKIEEVARALGLTDIGLERDVTELSGGQRTKVLLGKLLLEKPDILLLDEPTNYLDESHIEWLKRYLNDYENAFILISHDIPFLNSVINLIYHIDNGELTRYVGNYDDFSAGKNSIALNINGCVTKGAGSLTLADGAFPPINAEKSLAIRYKAKVSTNETMTNALAATVIFTIAAVAEGG